MKEKIKLSLPAQSLPSNRKFGIVIGSILIALFLFKMNRYLPIGILGFLLFFFGLFMPQFLSIPHKVWMKLGYIMHKITSPIIIFLLYVVVFCTIGFLLKVFKNGFDGKFGDESLSYWENKEETTLSNPMKYQF